MAIAAGDFWGGFMQNEAAGAACSYIATRGGAALGGLAGGSLGSALGPGGTVAGGTAGSFLGGAGGAALAAAFCPGQPPGAGENPLAPSGLQFTGGQCYVAYEAVWIANQKREDGSVFSSDASWPMPEAGRVTAMRVLNDDSGYRIFANINNNPEIQIFADISPARMPYATNLGVRRTDGQSDNCGNNPGYDRIPPSDDVPPIVDDPAAGRDINVDLDFGGNIVPVIGRLQINGVNFEDGAIQIGFDFGGLSFNYNPMNGDISIGDGGGGGGGGGGDGDGDGDGEQLAGVFYETTAETSKARYVLLNNNRYYFPRAGSIRFTSADGKHSEEVQINGAYGYAPNPARHKFDGYVVSKDMSIDFINTFPDYQPKLVTCKKESG